MQDDKTSNLVPNLHHPIYCTATTVMFPATKLAPRVTIRSENRAFYESKTAPAPPFFLSPFRTENYEQQNAIEEEDGRQCFGRHAHRVRMRRTASEK